MKVLDFQYYQVEIKKDSVLSPNEIQSILELYNLSFYDNRVSNPNQLNFLRDCISARDIFYWFLLKNHQGQLLGMVSLVHNFSQAYRFDLNLEFGENICSLAIAPEVRQRGLARLLMKQVINHASFCGLRPQDSFVLEIKKDNTYYQALNHLYTSLGFKYLQQTETGWFLKFR